MGPNIIHYEPIAQRPVRNDLPNRAQKTKTVSSMFYNCCTLRIVTERPEGLLRFFTCNEKVQVNLQNDECCSGYEKMRELDKRSARDLYTGQSLISTGLK